MNIRRDLFAGAIALTCLAGAAQANSIQKSTSSQPSVLTHQTTGQSTSSASQVSLTQQQKQQIFQAAQSLPQQNGQSASLSPGSKVPSNITLSPIPQQAKQNSQLQNSQIAKLQNGDVVVADRRSNTVQAVITQQDVNATSGQGTPNSLSTSPSSSMKK